MKNPFTVVRRSSTVSAMCATTLSLCLVPAAWAVLRSVFQYFAPGNTIFLVIERCMALDALGGFSMLLLKAARLAALTAAALICVFEGQSSYDVLGPFGIPFAMIVGFVLCAMCNELTLGCLFSLGLALWLVRVWMQESSANGRSSVGVLLLVLPLAAAILCTMLIDMMYSYDLLYIAVYLLALFGSYWAYRTIVKIGQQPGCGIFAFCKELPVPLTADSPTDALLLSAAALFDAVLCCVIYVTFFHFLWPYLMLGLETFRS